MASGLGPSPTTPPIAPRSPADVWPAAWARAPPLRRFARRAPAAGSSTAYGRGAAVLSVGIGVTGLITFAYFSLASYSLSEDEYGRITLLWSAVFLTVSVLYRPVEQLLSRTIADRDARGVEGHEHLRVAATIQLALGLLFAVVALILREPLRDDLFGGSDTLYWILIVTVLAYAASYFARGFLAGHHRFGLYGGLVLMEASSRCLFALAVAVGIAEGQDVVALGLAAAPIVSLAVVPWALGRRLRVAPPVADELPDPERAGTEPEFTLAHGTGFAVAVLAIMLSEQTFLNAGPLLVEAGEGARGAALAGFTFNVLLIARAPLQLFQAVQTSILPHLTRLRAGGETDPFRRSVNLTLIAIALFAAAVALAMLVAGPLLMDLVFGGDFDYERGGLVLISLRDGPLPGRGHAQPGAAGPRARPAGGAGLARVRGRVRALPAAGGLRRPRAAGGGGLPRRGRDPLRAALRALPARLRSFPPAWPRRSPSPPPSTARRGPPTAATPAGGWPSSLGTEVASVSLRAPPPLDRPLDVVRGEERVELRDGDTLVAEGERDELLIDVPDAVTPADAAAASQAGFERWAGVHPFPTCLVCGPQREPGDGMRVFPGRLERRPVRRRLDPRRRAWTTARVTCAPSSCGRRSTAPRARRWRTSAMGRQWCSPG